MSKKVKAADLIQPFQLEVVSGEDGIQRHIQTSDLSRPGLEMAGFFTYYPSDRVQILGRTELAFFTGLSQEQKSERMKLLCHAETPCIIVSRNMDVPGELILASNQNSVPVLRSSASTTTLFSRITDFLEGKLAPRTTMHGVLVEIYGIGVLITGGSGIGKSETALELVKRGHRLVADDAVEIRQTMDNTLIGNAPELIRHLLEIRGLGIINAMTLFGAGAVRTYKKIAMVIRMEAWQEDRQYDRIGLDEETSRIMDTEIPIITVPVKPGRNLAVIIEVAAMNYRLKRMGYNAALHFSNKLNASIMDDIEDME
jgi:HPr kinase/phosphorylase